MAQLAAGPLAGRLEMAIGFRATLATGGAFTTAAFVLLAFEHGHEWNFLAAGVLLGAGISFASMANLIVGAVPQSDVGVATGINTVTRTVGGAFGSAVATAILLGDSAGGLPSEGAYTAAFILAAAAACWRSAPRC